MIVQGFALGSGRPQRLQMPRAHQARRSSSQQLQLLQEGLQAMGLRVQGIRSRSRGPVKGRSLSQAHSQHRPPEQ